MPIPIPAPIAAMPTPIQITSDWVGMELAAAGFVAAVTSKAQTAAFARILFLLGFIVHLMSVQVSRRLLNWLTASGPCSAAFRPFEEASPSGAYPFAFTYRVTPRFARGFCIRAAVCEDARTVGEAC